MSMTNEAAIEIVEFKGHTVYKREDFTQEEIDRENIIAVMVLKDKLQICKFCGESGFENLMTRGCK